MLVQQQDPMNTSSMPHLQLDAEPLQQGEPRPGPQVPQAAQIAGHCRALGHTVLGTAAASPPGSPTSPAAPHLVALGQRVEVPGFDSSGEKTGHWAVQYKEGTAQCF